MERGSRLQNTAMKTLSDQTILLLPADNSKMQESVLMWRFLLRELQKDGLQQKNK